MNRLIKDTEVLSRTFETWQSAEPFRRRRRRFKAFTYGRQWGDAYRNQSGRIISEEQAIIENGRLPITNNLIRQLVKSIIGRYRYLSSGSSADGVDAMLHRSDDLSAMKESREVSPYGASDRRMSISKLDETDARALEEFLISGCAVQRISLAGEEFPAVVNVSPEMLIFEQFSESDASDCRFIGMLHDMPLAMVLRQFSEGLAGKAEAIKEAYRHTVRKVAALEASSEPADFTTPQLPGRCRVIEVWEKEACEILRCHDVETGDYYSLDYSESALEALSKRNASVKGAEEQKVRYSLDFADCWTQKWLTPRGELLGCNRYYEEDACPFVLKFYPLIDGEIHSLVEDVIDQQKYVNRLITMLDDIISSSAKGVLLYPTDQLPEGFTWRDLRRIWSNPNGILPYKRTATGVAPHQIHTAGTSVGATEMLKLQLQLFDEISGTTGAMKGKSSGASGAEMLRTELENGTISLLDILASFRGFVSDRNKKLNI